MYTIIYFTGILIAVLLIYPFFLALLSVVIRKYEPHKSRSKSPHFQCIITAYRDATTALPLINSLLKQEYDNFDVILIADRCPTIHIPEHERLHCIYPPQPLNSKLKSIREGLLIGSKDYSIIFDPDNVVKPDFLTNLASFHQTGYDAVQCKRTAKNLDNYLSCLDAAGETYKNFVERKMPYLLGSSATIAGSGISVKSSLLEEFLKSKEVQKRINGVISGEDKMLQNYLIEKGLRSRFLVVTRNSFLAFLMSINEMI